MSLMPPTDSMFLIAESREQPMHVGGLQLFRLPEDAGSDYLGDLYRSTLEVSDIAPLFRKRARRSLTSLGQWEWVYEDDVDLEHHVRHSALPKPGRVRELLALTSRLHGSLLDRQRPLWEGHLIEGLDDGRFAVYTKMHHALLDGVSALRLLQRSLSTDPDARDIAPPWAIGLGGAASSGTDLTGLLKGALSTAGDVIGLGPGLVRVAQRELRDRGLTLSLQAPRSMFNVAITGSRRFAAQSWPLERLRAIGKAADATVNDVLLTVCGGALRSYLLEQRDLPDSPLIAMVPISLRTGDHEGGGNAVGSILCNLGTDVADPAERLSVVRRSMRVGKDAYTGLSSMQISALSAMIMAPLLVNSTLGAHRFTRPPFNLIISNIPGPADDLYWNGARLEGIYPLSIPLNGQALNITVTSNAGEMHVGLTGCRRSVPHLQHLLGFIDTSLDELAAAVA
ncbi:MAG: diacylglycerol O-acyltransferase / wax synthase [Frankiales bacterium]|jgi:WS/DGAT/MGAT family acyltransferase|nr:diacylglycerol O-acyltransferase / wax synthase [Frankiales bacterium]